MEKIGINQNEMNFFRIIGKQRSETVHSAFLAYLLHPQNQICGEIFLKDFIKTCLSKNNVNSDQRKFFEGNISFENVNVICEESLISDEKKGRKDIVVSGDDFYICIENKIGATDSEGQLDKYLEDTKLKHPEMFSRPEVSGDYSEKSTLHVYLTPLGAEPVNPLKYKNWILLSYKDDISGILPESENVLLNNYKEIMKDILNSEDFYENEYIQRINNLISGLKEDFLEKYKTSLHVYNLDGAEISGEPYFYSEKYDSEKYKQNNRHDSMLHKKIYFSIETDGTRNNGAKKFLMEFCSSEKDKILYGTYDKAAVKNYFWGENTAFKNQDDRNGRYKNNILYCFDDKQDFEKWQKRSEWIKDNFDIVKAKLLGKMEIFFGIN